MSAILKYILTLIVEGILERILVPMIKGVVEHLKLDRIFKKSKDDGKVTNDKIDNANTIDDARDAMDELR